MTNMIKKIKILFFTLSLFLLSISPAYADEFNNLNIDVSIDKNGIASISETWDTYDEEGTEKYKPIENLKNIKIEDFKAERNGNKYSELSPWNIDSSFEEKANHYGINYTDKGIELCWGIGEYGKNQHKIEYKINPIIVSLEDYDMLYWQFVNSDMSTPPENVEIKISSYEKFDSQIKMWGFGMEGNINNVDGKIVMKSNGDIDYATVMLRFPKAYFNTSFKENKNFKEYADMAIEGSDWEDNQGAVSKDKIGLGGIIGIITTGIITLLGILTAGLAIGISAGNNPLNNLDRNKILPKVKDLKDQYFGEVPYDDELENLYLFLKKAYGYDISPENFMNAFILKWIYQKSIRLNSEESGFFKTKKQTIEILKTPEKMGSLESEFFNHMTNSISYSSRGEIDQKSFEKYIQKNPEKIKNLFERFDTLSSISMEKQEYIKSERIKALFGKRTNLNPTNKGLELYSNLIKFKNYLEDYSLIEEREAREVAIWDYFMIFAALYGISDKVFKNLQETYPGYERQSMYTYNTLMWTRSYASHINSSYSNFISSGSGGSTSFGGGGGSFGGGSGGGSR